MECLLQEDLCYTSIAPMIQTQQMALAQKMSTLCSAFTIHPGLDYFRQPNADPLPLEHIPGSFTSFNSHPGCGFHSNSIFSIESTAAYLKCSRSNSCGCFGIGRSFHPIAAKNVIQSSCFMPHRDLFRQLADTCSIHNVSRNSASLGFSQTRVCLSLHAVFIIHSVAACSPSVVFCAWLFDCLSQLL